MCLLSFYPSAILFVCLFVCLLHVIFFLLETDAAVFMKKSVIVVKQSLFFINWPDEQKAAGFDKQNAARPRLAHYS